MVEWSHPTQSSTLRIPSETFFVQDGNVVDLSKALHSTETENEQKQFFENELSLNGEVAKTFTMPCIVKKRRKRQNAVKKRRTTVFFFKVG